MFSSGYLNNQTHCRLQHFSNSKKHQATMTIDIHSVRSQKKEFMMCRCGNLITLPEFLKAHGFIAEIQTRGTVFSLATGCFYSGEFPAPPNFLYIYCNRCRDLIGASFKKTSGETNYLLFTGKILVYHSSHEVINLFDYLQRKGFAVPYTLMIATCLSPTEIFFLPITAPTAAGNA